MLQIAVDGVGLMMSSSQRGHIVLPLRVVGNPVSGFDGWVERCWERQPPGVHVVVKRHVVELIWAQTFWVHGPGHVDCPCEQSKASCGELRHCWNRWLTCHGCWPVLPSSMPRSKTVGDWYLEQKIDRSVEDVTAAMNQRCWSHCCQQNVDIHKSCTSKCWIRQMLGSPNLAQKDMLCITDMLYRTRAYIPSCSRHAWWSSTYWKSCWNTVWISCWYTPCWSIGDHYEVVHVVNLCWHHGSKDVCLCVHATHDVRTMCTRSHINALAAVKLLLVVVWKLSDDGCWSQHHWCDAEASLLQRTWWRCRPGCWRCWSWQSSQGHVRPAVV